MSKILVNEVAPRSPGIPVNFSGSSVPTYNGIPLDGGTGGGGGGGYTDPRPVRTTPLAPTSLTIVGSFKTIFLSWLMEDYRNRAYIRVFRNTVDNRSTATLIGQTAVDFYTDTNVAYGVTYYYWIAAVNLEDVQGPDNAPTGTAGTILQIAGVDIGTATIEASKLADGSISASKLASGAIDSLTKFANGLEPVFPVSVLPSPVGYTGPKLVILTTNGKLYRYVSGSWTTAVDSADISGVLSSSNIPNLDASKITTGTFAISRIADGSLTASKLATNLEPVTLVTSVPSTKSTTLIYNTTNSRTYAWNSTTNQYELDKVNSIDIVGTIANTQIADGAITTPKLAANAVTATNIAAGTITADKIQSNSLTAAQIASGAITTDELAANSVTTAKLTVADFTNLCENSNFELGNVGWTSDPGWTIANDAVNAESGSWVAVGSGATAGDLASSLAFPVVQGDTFYAEARIKTTGTATGLVKISFRNSSLVLVNEQTGNAINSGTYQTSAVSAVCPANATRCRVEVRVTSGTGSIYVDNVRIRRAVNAQLIVDGSITSSKIVADAITSDKIAAGAVTADELAANSVIAGKIAAGAVSAAQIAAGAITTDKLLVTGRGPAINYDPTLLDNTAWLQIEGTYPTRVNVTDGLSGTTAFRFSAPGAIQGLKFPASPGRQYRVSAYIRRTSGTGVAYLRLFFYNSSGTSIGYIVTGISPALTDFESFNPNSTWTRYTGYAVAPAGTVEAAPAFWGSYLTGGVTDIQDIRVDEYVGADLIVDGAITASKIQAGSITAGSGIIANGAITNAMIQNAAIDNAKITTGLDASKITVGTLSGGLIAANSIGADKLVAGSITANQISSSLLSSDNVLTRNILIRDASGNVIFGSGNNLNWGNITGQPSTIFNSNISLSSNGQLNGAGGGQVTITGLGYTGNLNATSDLSLTRSSTFISINGNYVVKVNGTGTWDQNAYSVEGFSGGAATSFQFNNFGEVMAGLSLNPSGSAFYSNVNYAWYQTGSGSAIIYINGSNTSITTTLSSTDVFGVTYDGSVVRWLKNGNTIHGISATISAPLYFNVSIATINAQLNSIKFTAYGNPSAVSPSNPLTSGNVSTYIQSAAIGFAQVGQLKTQNLEVGSVSARSYSQVNSGVLTVPNNSTFYNVNRDLTSYTVPSGTSSILGISNIGINIVLNNAGVPKCDFSIISITITRTDTGDILGTGSWHARLINDTTFGGNVYKTYTSICIPFINSLTTGTFTYRAAFSFELYQANGSAFTATNGGSISITTQTAILENKV